MSQIMARLRAEPGAWRAIVVEHGVDGKPLEPEPDTRRVLGFDVAAWGFALIERQSMFGRFSPPDGNVDMLPLAKPEDVAKGFPERLDTIKGYLGVAATAEPLADAYDRLSGNRGMREAMARITNKQSIPASS